MGALVAPQMEAVWLGIGELAVLLAGGWVLFAKLAGLREASPLTFATRENSVHLARMVLHASPHCESASRQNPFSRSAVFTPRAAVS
jgi:hypothetical protein